MPRMTKKKFAKKPGKYAKPRKVKVADALKGVRFNKKMRSY